METSKGLFVIFMTGSTGLLGSAFIADIIKTKIECDFVLLVRAATEAEGLLRVNRAVRKFLPADADWSRVGFSVICGSVTDDSWVRDARLSAVTHSIHLAANTTFGIEPDLSAVNIDGAIRVAKAMIGKQSLIRHLHVGTAMISGSNPPPLVYEDDYPRKGIRHVVRYTATKAEAESRLKELERNLPMVVARPSIVVGHSIYGCAPSGSIFWFFRVIDALHTIAWSRRSRIDIIPFDYAASALRYLLLKPVLAKDRYHISAGDRSAVRWHEIAQALSENRKPSSGYREQQFDFGIRTTAELEKAFGGGQARKLARALKPYCRFAALDVVFDNERLLAEGMPAPTKCTEYFGKCLKTTQQRSIYDHMTDD